MYIYIYRYISEVYIYIVGSYNNLRLTEPAFSAGIEPIFISRAWDIHSDLNVPRENAAESWVILATSQGIQQKYISNILDFLINPWIFSKINLEIHFPILNKKQFLFLFFCIFLLVVFLYSNSSVTFASWQSGFLRGFFARGSTVGWVKNL